jgi:hypothetical protein
MSVLILCSVDRAASLYNSCKWPTWRTILFSICLFQFSTCFEQPRAHHQENQLYQYNIWYVSLCVGDRLVCRSGRKSSLPTCTLDGHLHRVTHTRCCIDTTDSPYDEHEVARNMYRAEINIQNKNCASSWSFTRIIIRRSLQIAVSVRPSVRRWSGVGI